ncbi:MAG: ABC transporter substrate-binding protein [Chloroflexi bacterium RBG_16_54_18]|nr:MAG: ABC transporter substrate-binding protein [Chloroflexi bacterium RBG_16_54_18]
MHRPSSLVIGGIVLVILALSSCTTAAMETLFPTSQSTSVPTQEHALTLKVMTHDSFDISEEVLAEFEQANNVKVQFIKSGDTGTALNKAILSRENPLADVFYGVDNTFLSRALNEDIFEPYDSPLLAAIPAGFKLDLESRALPVDYGDVCLNYDKGYFVQQGVAPPMTLKDLSQPEYKSLLVVENPATSSPGLAFLLATIGNFGSDGYLEYWEGLVANDVLVVNDWETAYYSEFSGSSGKGPRPIVVSYSSSPAFEVLYSEPAVDEPPTAAVTANETCFRQIEFVGILSGTQNRELARKWVDFMLSRTFQEDIPLKMFVFPVNSEAVLDQIFLKYLSFPDQTAIVSPDEIALNREVWIKAWTEQVLR